MTQQSRNAATMVRPSTNPRSRSVNQAGRSKRFGELIFRSASRGSMLLDVLFGAVLIGAVATALFLSFSLANRIALRAKHVAIAKDIAQTEIEQIRRTDFDSLGVGTTSSAVAELPNGQKQVNLAYYDPPNNRVISVTVTITWRERQGTETYRLTTLATEGGTGQ